MFLQVSVCPHRGGMCGFIWGGHVWFYSGGWVCMVLFGGCVVLFGGVCVILFGGGGCMVFFRGACMVLFRGRVWFHLGEGMHGFFSIFGYNEIRSMNGWYASYWNAFLFSVFFLIKNRTNDSYMYRLPDSSVRSFSAYPRSWFSVYLEIANLKSTVSVHCYNLTRASTLTSLHKWRWQNFPSLLRPSNLFLMMIQQD